MEWYESLMLGPAKAGTVSTIVVVPIGTFDTKAQSHLPDKLTISRNLAEELVANFDAKVMKTLPFVDDGGHEEDRATGWFKSLSVGTFPHAVTGKPMAGLLAEIEWTSLGESLLGDRQYRYLSAVIAPYRDEETGRTYTVLRSATLTNRPVMKMMPEVTLETIDGSPTHDVHASAVAIIPPAVVYAFSELTPLAETADVDGKEHPAGDFAYVPDPEKPSTWKLPIFDKAHIGAAIAALKGGFRGSKVDIPDEDKAAVVAKVRRAWLKAHPDKTKADLPLSEIDDSVAEREAESERTQEMWQAQTVFGELLKEAVEALSGQALRERIVALATELADTITRLVPGEALPSATPFGAQSPRREGLGMPVFDDTGKEIVLSDVPEVVELEDRAKAAEAKLADIVTAKRAERVTAILEAASKKGLSEPGRKLLEAMLAAKDGAIVLSETETTDDIGAIEKFVTALEVVPVEETKAVEPPAQDGLSEEAKAAKAVIDKQLGVETKA